MLRRPSAFMPPAMSLAALIVVGLHLALHGPSSEPDEGAAAHVWQLLMAGQIPFIVFFLVKWLPQAPRAAWPVPVLQLAAALAALAPVYFLHL